MSEILFHYQKINPTTWAYLSSLLMIGLFFQFNRFWSVRNLDLVLLILLAPGLLMVNEAREVTKSAQSSAAHKEQVAASTQAVSTGEVAATESRAAVDQPSSNTPVAAATADDELQAS